MQVPAEYQGREQSYLKHRVLEEYLLVWGLAVGSASQRRPVRLCYVDGFAGPWQAKDAELRDTSIAIGLDALEAAAKTWREKGYPIEVDAYFVEKDPRAFASLESFLTGRTGVVRTKPFLGEFGAHVDTLRRLLGNDPGFIFVDPKGWKGAAMRSIKPLLASSRQRDVLVNVMFDHINRFKDDSRKFLRDQMRDFFGLDDRDMPDSLGEEDLFALYRSRLKSQRGVRYAADLAIPHPTVERTKFRLVVGGNNPKVLDLFRKIERKVIGAEAATVREDAGLRAKTAKTGQLTLLAAPPATDPRYESLHTRAQQEAPRELLALLAKVESITFKELWPRLLETHHIPKTELGQLIWEMYKRHEVQILNRKPSEQSVKDDHRLAASGR